MNTKNGIKQILINMVSINDKFKNDFNRFLKKDIYDSIIGIDPGFNTSLCHISKQRILILQISAPIKIHYLQKMKFLNDKFEQALYRCSYNDDYTKVFLEDVEVWGAIGAQGKSNIGKASLKSEVSSAKGDLLKLARVIGMYCGIMFDYDFNIELVPALHWKGQLTKKATTKWIYDELPELTNHKLTEHMLDSIGICLSKIYNWKAGSK